MSAIEIGVAFRQREGEREKERDAQRGALLESERTLREHTPIRRRRRCPRFGEKNL